MTALVEVNTSYAGDEKLQQVIIKCLDDDDKTIGKKVTLITYPQSYVIDAVKTPKEK